MDNNEHSTNLAEVGTDYISRQAAIDAIDRITRTDNWQAAVSMALLDLPSAQPEQPMVDIAKVTMAMAKKADMVAVTRCKDCTKREYCRTSTVWAVSPKDDWFCADAERRTDG